MHRRTVAAARTTAYDRRLTWAFWGVVYGLTLALIFHCFGSAARGGEPVAWADLYAPAKPAAKQQRCVTCQFDCRCGAECKCPQAAPAKAADPRYANARVREEDGDRLRAAPPPAYARAGTTKLIGGYWYRADGAGGWSWCEECNGYPHSAFLNRFAAPARQAVTYVWGPPSYGWQTVGGSCASGNCGR